MGCFSSKAEDTQEKK
jgi:serine/threonine protein kinase